ncbi:hypothetical protein PtA15_3A599 [Puccinia triticina]|uniref:ARID domain-containing protein n=1 Tax=Puccinia triticina TaxID=208348 RepID=A0ABY7CDQ0_9BASI|nr:uncharacterized protein PtA15_3A599 [Puccinia triticina]WAQ83230.1 hypothetical protein PtA15_3A599 [Puccinia triticina]
MGPSSYSLPNSAPAMPASPALSNSSLQFNSQLATHSITPTPPLNMPSSWQSPSLNSASLQSSQPIRSPEDPTQPNLIPQLMSQVITAIGLNSDFDRSNPASSVRRYDPRTLPIDPRTSLRLNEAAMAAIEQAYLHETCGVTELKLYKEYLINQHQLKISEKSSKLHDHPPLSSPNTSTTNITGIHPVGMNNSAMAFRSSTPANSGQNQRPQLQSAPPPGQPGPRHSSQRPLGPPPPTSLNSNYNQSQQPNQQVILNASNTSNQAASSPTAIANPNQAFAHAPSTPMNSSHSIAPSSPNPAQRFLASLSDFLTKSSRQPLQLSFPPLIEGQAVDLYKLFGIVQQNGGSANVARLGGWPLIAAAIDLLPSNDPSGRRSSQNEADPMSRYSPEQIHQLQHPTQPDHAQPQFAQQHLQSNPLLQSSIPPSSLQNSSSNWTGNNQNTFVGTSTKAPLHQTHQASSASQHPPSASPQSMNAVPGAQNPSMNWPGSTPNSFTNSPTKTPLHLPQQTQPQPPPLQPASQNVHVASSLPSLNSNQNPAVNWPGAPSNPLSTSPVTAVYNQSNIPSQSPGETGQLTSWNGGAVGLNQPQNQIPTHGPTALVPNLYNQPPNHPGNSQYVTPGAFFGHQPGSGPHSASFSSGGSPMLNTNMSLAASSIGVAPTTPQITNKNLAINPSHQDPSALPGGPPNGAMTPAGSQAGSPGSLVRATSESVSNTSTSLPNSSNSNGKRARSSKKSIAQEGSAKNLNNSNKAPPNALDKKKRMKRDHESNSPLVTSKGLPLNDSQNGTSSSRTPSVASNHPQPQISPSFQGENEATLGALPPSNAPPNLNGPSDQPSPALQQASHSQQPSPAGGAMVELMPPLIQSSDGATTMFGSQHEKSNSPQHLEHPPTDHFGPRAITPSVNPPSSGKNQGYPSPHPPGSPLKGKPPYQSDPGHPNGIAARTLQRPPVPPPRTDYVPLCKPADNTGGWDLKEAEEIYNFRLSSKPRRSLDDLGLVDVHSLVMSLRSRIGSEVTYALNTLTFLGPHLKIFRDETSGSLGILSMPLAMCEDLLEELLDLLEDVAFKPNWNRDDDDQACTEEQTATGFYDMMAHALDEDARPPPKDSPSAEDEDDSDDEESDLRPPIGQVEIIFSILNILRSFALSEDSAPYIGRTARTTSLLIGLCEFSANPQNLRKSLRLTKLERLRIRREVLQILSDVGHGIYLDEQTDRVVSALLRLALFFLVDSPHQIDRTPFEGEGTIELKPGVEVSPAIQLRLRSLSIVPSHVEAATSLVSKVGTLDSNRRRIEESLCRTRTEWVVEELIETLTKMLPITGEEMVLVVSEDDPRVRAEVLAMGLFNLVSLKPSSMAIPGESRLKTRSMLLRALVRTLGRFLVIGDDQVSIIASHRALSMQILVERLIETMRVLIEQVDLPTSGPGFTPITGLFRGSNTLRHHAGKLSFGEPPMNWFGGGFESDESEKEIGSSLVIQPSSSLSDEEEEEGLQKVQLLPKLSTDLKSSEGENVPKTDIGNLSLAGLSSVGAVRWRAEFIKMLAGFGGHLNRNPPNHHNHPNSPNLDGPIGSLITPNAFSSLVKILD